MCLSYYSITVKIHSKPRQHTQKKAFTKPSSFKGLACCPHGWKHIGTALEQQLRTLHPDQQTGREWDTGPGVWFWNLKDHPQGHTFSKKDTASETSKEFIKWGLSMQIYMSPWRDILTQTNILYKVLKIIVIIFKKLQRIY